MIQTLKRFKITLLGQNTTCKFLGGIPFIKLQNDTWTTNKQWKMRWRANPLISWGVSYVRCFEECWHDWMQNQVQTQLFILLLVILLSLQHYCPLVFQPAAEMAQLLMDIMRGLLSVPGRTSTDTCLPPLFLFLLVILLSLQQYCPLVFQPAAEMAQLLTDIMRGLLSVPGRTSTDTCLPPPLLLPPCHTSSSLSQLSPCFPASCWDGPAVDRHYEGTAVSPGQNQAQAPVRHLLQAVSRLHKEAALESPGQLPASCACGEHVSLDDGEILCGGGHTLQEAVSGKTFF